RRRCSICPTLEYRCTPDGRTSLLIRLPLVSPRRKPIRASGRSHRLRPLAVEGHSIPPDRNGWNALARVALIRRSTGGQPIVFCPAPSASWTLALASREAAQSYP